MTDNPLTKEKIAGLERFAEHNTSQNYITAVAIDPRMLSRLLAMLKDKDAAVERARVEEREACALIALAIDSNRGNEKEIARAIRSRKPEPRREGKDAPIAASGSGSTADAPPVRTIALSGANAVASATSASPSCFECDTPLIGPICPRCSPASPIPDWRDAIVEIAKQIIHRLEGPPFDLSGPSARLSKDSHEIALIKAALGWPTDDYARSEYAKTFAGLSPTSPSLRDAALEEAAAVVRKMPIQIFRNPGTPEQSCKPADFDDAADAIRALKSDPSP